MVKKFYPQMAVNTIYDIKIDIFKHKNIKAVILDVDNTLVRSNVKDADDYVIKWITILKQNGLKVAIVSNGRKRRVERFNEKLNLIAVYNAGKPRKKGLLKAIKLMDVKPEQTAVIGDQIFTDIYGGNKIKAYTILVKPIAFRELFLTKIKRIFEIYVLWRYNKYVKSK